MTLNLNIYIILLDKLQLCIISIVKTFEKKVQQSAVCKSINVPRPLKIINLH